MDSKRQNFDEKAKIIKSLHWNQTPLKVHELKTKYQTPVFGAVNPWTIIEKLSLCIDPTDRELYSVSQFIHTCQVLESMEKAGIQDEEFLLAGLLHDIGKVLLLTDELPENVVCDNGVIFATESGIGWENCVTHWNHDEYGYEKLKAYLPNEISWLIRFHSMKLNDTIKYANAYDKTLIEKYLIPFRDHDKLTKSIYHLPDINIDKYTRLVEKHLPKEIIM